MWVTTLLVSGSVIFTVDSAYKMTGGAMNIAPGWTDTEFNWRFSRPGAKSKVFVVGASNVNWALAESVMSDNLSKRCEVDVDAANIGLSGHNTISILESLSRARLEPAVIVYSYDPISAGVFSRQSPQISKTVLRQEKQDSAIAINIGEALPTFLKTPKELLEHFLGKRRKPEIGSLYWATRTAHSEGMVSGTRRYYASSKVPSYSELSTDQETRLEARLKTFFENDVTT